MHCGVTDISTSSHRRTTMEMHIFFIILLLSCKGGEKKGGGWGNTHLCCVVIETLVFVQDGQDNPDYRGVEWDDPRNDGEDNDWDCALTPDTYEENPEVANAACCQAGKWLVDYTRNPTAEMCRYCEWGVAATFRGCNGGTFLNCCLNELEVKNLNCGGMRKEPLLSRKHVKRSCCAAAEFFVHSGGSMTKNKCEFCAKKHAVDYRYKEECEIGFRECCIHQLR